MSPLAGLRVLAIEQMQALPYATQLLASLGAEVIKIETPRSGDLGRGSTPSMTDPYGRQVGATFLRNNLGKQSICIDLKHPEGRELVLRLVPRFDVVCENLKPGSAERLGLGFGALRDVHERVVYVSVSGFGNLGDSPYRTWPAYAPIVEAMSGIYERTRRGDEAPTVSPVGALGDMSAALFATVGVLAALRARDETGQGQRVDVAMFDAVIAMTDIVANFWSLGLRGGQPPSLISHGFRAGDGWFVLQIGREPQMPQLLTLIGRADLCDDPRLATRAGWIEHLEDLLRPAVERWAAGRSKVEVCHALAAAGLAAGPCLSDEELVVDPHVVSRRVLVSMDRSDGVAQPVLVPANPVRIDGTAPPINGRRVPWLGEHTTAVMVRELELDDDDLQRLTEAGVIS